MSLGRPMHYLRGSSTCRTPRRAIFFDCESLPHSIGPNRESHALRLWTACYVEWQYGTVVVEEWNSGKCADSFWALVGCKVNRRETLWVFAHNLSFDWTLIGGWDALQMPDVKLERCVIEDPPVILGMTCNGCRITAVDTLNYWPSSLATLGKSIGVAKADMPLFDDPDNVWFAYCANDTRIIKEAVCGLVAMLAERNLGNFASTASGISWSCYRHRFMTHAILIHNDENATKLERAACHGGRCEVWRIGRINNTIHVLDVNSLYPSEMMQHKFPTKLLEYGHGISVHALRDLLASDVGVIATVRLHTDGEFPRRTDSGYAMATGDFSTVLAGQELGRAISGGSVVSVNSFSLYRMDWIFADFVEHFYALRLDCRRSGNRAGAALCKTLLNSLWGKFQQRTHSWRNASGVVGEEDFAQWTYHNVLSGMVRSYRAVAGLVQCLQERGEADNSFPAIGAYVLSYGRERLRELRHTAGLENCYYCDTDSLHCNDAGVDRLNRSGQLSESVLGKMKLVGSWPHAQYYGQKDYELGDSVILAGRKATAVGTERGLYWQDEFQGVKSVVQTEPRPEIIVTRRTVCRGSNVINGVVGPDGRVTPVVLRE